MAAGRYNGITYTLRPKLKTKAKPAAKKVKSPVPNNGPSVQREYQKTWNDIHDAVQKSING